MIYRTIYEVNGSVTHWESADNGKTWRMTSQEWPS